MVHGFAMLRSAGKKIFEIMYELVLVFSDACGMDAKEVFDFADLMNASHNRL